MKQKLPEKLELARQREGPFASHHGDLHGAFFVVAPMTGTHLKILSSGIDHEHGWEHVSVSLYNRIPNWKEMCFVKELFWNDDECVVQYHPAKSEYVNVHPNCLHLWKPIDGKFPIPPSHLVGPK